MLDAQCSTCGAWHAVLEESVLCRRICHCAWHNVDTGFRGALAKWQEFFLGSATLPQPLMPCKEAPGILDVGLAAILKPILCKSFWSAQYSDGHHACGLGFLAWLSLLPTPGREGKGYIAVPACGGSLAEAKPLVIYIAISAYKGRRAETLRLTTRPGQKGSTHKTWTEKDHKS
eukprot:1158098-Pelagomonas_calceolata.AAC.4